jgi:general secretion pathway protein J
MTERERHLLRRSEGSDHDQSGFTLVEMIVALALLSLVAGFLVSIVRDSGRVFGVIGRSTEVARVMSVQHYLRDAIGSAIGNPGSTVQSDAEPYLTGAASALRVTTSRVPGTFLPGLYQVEIGLEPDGNGRTYSLVAAFTLARPRDSQAPALTERTVLLQGVAGLRLSYFGANNDPSEPATVWQSAWTIQELPRLIAMDVAFPSGDVRSWPRLLVALNVAD